jgi:hypothetical protein
MIPKHTPLFRLLYFIVEIVAKLYIIVVVALISYFNLSTN